jgi:hypothetical protein
MRGLRAVYTERERCRREEGDRSCPFDNCCRGEQRCASPNPDDFDLPRFGKELLVPYFDGVVPMRIRDYDDRPTVVHYICEVLRNCIDYHMTGCPRPDGPNSDYVEVDPMRRRYGSALCTPIPPDQTLCTAAGEVQDPPTPTD